MFDDIANQKKSHTEAALGVVTAFVLAPLIFGIFAYFFLSLGINGYGSFPLIGTVNVNESEQYRWLANLAWLVVMVCMAFGLSQLVYIIPLFYLARAKGHTDFAKGLIIGAALIFLLQSSCLAMLVIIK